MNQTITAADAAEIITGRAAARTRADGATVIAIAGPVAVGKSMFAALVADALIRRALRAETVSTDGFLFSNSELAARGLVERKGFPESYDVEKLQRFLRSVRAGVDGIAVPEYSHETYDVLPRVTRVLPRVDVLVLEGVNALSSTNGFVDLGVYVDAPDEVVEWWFVERFEAYCANPPADSFYMHFAQMDEDAIERVARAVWQSVNLVNLREHISPSRRYADVIVEKTRDHRVGAIADVGETMKA